MIDAKIQLILYIDYVYCSLTDKLTYSGSFFFL